ncbi:MAG: EAL domain-containing protein [Erythrobacter sp.]
MEEHARLSDLRALALDRVRDRQLFTNITRLAAEHFGCPVSLISIVEEDRQWFLANTGTDLKETPRDISVCVRCIEAGEPFLVSDAATDPRLSRTLPPETPPEMLAMRSYMGVPVASESGALIGTLCVISNRRSAFCDTDIPGLRVFAQLVEQGIAAHTQTLDLARANGSLKELNQVFKQAEAAAQIGSWRLELASGEVQWSDQVYAVHGLSPGSELDLQNAINFYEPDDRETVQSSLNEAIESGEPFSFEATIRRTDGQLRRIRSLGERIDNDGTPEAMAGVFVDCTDEHQHMVALQRAATRDGLTGLYNRSEFDRRLGEALAKARANGEAHRVTVLLLDLDGFKDVNDRLGHLVGDSLLVKIAKALDRKVEDEAFLARWGGDEFAILFESRLELDQATRFAEDLITEITDQVRVGESTIQVGASCGIAQMLGQATSEEIVRRADLAMYYAKVNERGGVQCWSENIESTQAARQSAIARLTGALDCGRAFAAYQPIVSLDDGQTVAVEALLRLREPDGSIVSAGEIFPALLDPVLARRVSSFMIEQIAAEAPELLALIGQELQIGINVTEADLRRGNFVQIMEDLIEASVLKPQNIVLEVTETMLILDETGAIRAMLQDLDKLGFTIALDDFGTGFSSLTHLRDFPIRKVKIDRDFIAAMTHDHQSRLIVQAMVQMGHSLGLGIVAEGIETDEQLTFLKSIGCSHGQGYKFARPVSLDDITARMSTGQRKVA